MVKLLQNVPQNSSLAFHVFVSSAYFQKYKRFVDESAEVPMAETVVPTLDQMFEEIRYKSVCIDAYTVNKFIIHRLHVSGWVG